MIERAEIDELVAVSLWAGRDVLVVQGGGGNTSVKSADGVSLGIKASGFRLSDVTPDRGWVECHLSQLRSVLAAPRLNALPDRPAHEQSVPLIQNTVAGATTLRPSLETSFHAALAGRVVLHTHPVFLNAFACMKGGRAVLEAAVGEPFAWVGYHVPGYALGRAVERASAAFLRAHGREPRAVVLASHGLIASGRSVDEVIETTERFIAAGRRVFGPLDPASTSSVEPPPALDTWARAVRDTLPTPNRLITPGMFGGLIGGPDQPGLAVFPDDVVCHVHSVPVVRPDETDSNIPPETADVLRRGRGVIRVAGLGYVIVGPSPTAGRNIAENLLANLLTRELVARKGRLVSLPPDEIAYLETMDSERYRQAVAART